MFNQFKISQKDSSCLNPSQSLPSADTGNSCEGTRMNMNGMNGNSNCSNGIGNMLNATSANFNNVRSPEEMKWLEQALTNPQLAGSAKFLLQNVNYVNTCSGPQNGTGNVNGGMINMNDLNNINNMNGNTAYNNTNMPFAAANNITNNECTDDMNWLEQALENPQLASSAKFLLQTTNYLNTCSGSRGNGTGNGNVVTGASMPSMLVKCSNNTPSKNQAHMRSKLLGDGAQGNFMHGNSSTTNPSNSHQITRNSSAGSQMKLTPGRQGALSVLSTTSDSSRRTGITDHQGNTFNNTGFVPNNMLNMHAQAGNSYQHSDQQCFPSSNQGTAGIQIQQFQKQQFIHQAASPPLQYTQNQTLNQVINNNFCWNNGNLVNNNQNVAVNNQMTRPPFDDEFNNIEPADYRQETSEDFDISFLLDDGPPDDSSKRNPLSAAAMGADQGSSAMPNSSQLCAIPTPRTKAAAPRPAPGSQPGSSQQMQEHLREITKQHMQEFQMTHAKQQLKANKKQKKAHKVSDNADGSFGVTPQGQNKPSRHNRTEASASCAGKLSATHGYIPANLVDPNFNQNMGGSVNSAVLGLTNSQNGHDIAISTNESHPNTNSFVSNSPGGFNERSRHQYLASVGGGTKRKCESSVQTKCSRMPQMKNLYEYVESMLDSRGYSLTKLHAKEIGYITEPSPLQSASFGFAVCSSIKRGGAGRLSALLSSGLSPNPVNKFGDSPFFLACKRGLPDLIKTFLDHGTDVRVADGFGRTALHYVAWSNDPCFASAKLLLTADARLICVMDNHGNTPLDFVGDSNRLQWLEFLESAKDLYWPPIKSGSPYAPVSKNGTILSDPPNALSVELAEKVASGHVLPEEAKRLNMQKDTRDSSGS